MKDFLARMRGNQKAEIAGYAVIAAGIIGAFGVWGVLVIGGVVWLNEVVDA